MNYDLSYVCRAFQHKVGVQGTAGEAASRRRHPRVCQGRQADSLSCPLQQLRGGGQVRGQVDRFSCLIYILYIRTLVCNIYVSG